jgi:hypothetical protein
LTNFKKWNLRLSREDRKQRWVAYLVLHPHSPLELQEAVVLELLAINIHSLPPIFVLHWGKIIAGNALSSRSKSPSKCDNADCS